jgi:hypothetical protein
MTGAPDLASLGRAWLERNAQRNAVLRIRMEQVVPRDDALESAELQGPHEETAGVPPFHALSAEQRNAVRGPLADVEHDVEQFVERAAIAEHEGGLPRGWAEALARVELWEKPSGTSGAHWSEQTRKAWVFADRYGAALDAAGWTFAEIFGNPRAWFDRRGAVWLEQGLLEADVVDIDVDRIRWQAPYGRTLTKWKAGRTPGVSTGDGS